MTTHAIDNFVEERNTSTSYDEANLKGYGDFLLRLMYLLMRGKEMEYLQR